MNITSVITRTTLGTAVGAETATARGRGSWTRATTRTMASPQARAPWSLLAGTTYTILGHRRAHQRDWSTPTIGNIGSDTTCGTPVTSMFRSSVGSGSGSGGGAGGPHSEQHAILAIEKAYAKPVAFSVRTNVMYDGTLDDDSPVHGCAVR